MVKLLLDHGANPNTRSQMYPTALFVSIGKFAETADKTYLNIAKILLEKGANPNIETETNNLKLWPIHAALTGNNESNNMKAVKLLLDYGANLDVMAPPQTQTPLVFAITSGQNNIVKLLLDNNSKVNLQMDLKNPKGEEVKNGTALTTAIATTNSEAVKLLLQKNPNTETLITVIKNNGDSVLFNPIVLSLVYKNKDIIKLLLNYGININAVLKEEEHQIPVLGFTIGTGDMEIVKMFINNGAKINKEVIQIAKESKNKDIISLVTSINNKKIIENTNQLFKASFSGNLTAAKQAINNIALINALDKNGMTPLMYASQKGHKEVVELLLDNGANTNVKDKRGYTALMYSQKYKNLNIQNLLKSHGAK